MTLVEFLRARVDEDEAAARAAILPAHDRPGAYKPHPELAAWSYSPDGEVEYVSTPEMRRHEYAETYLVTAGADGEPAVDDRVGPHIARHDPARVLADVDAKRRIVDHAEHWEETLYATPEGWTAVAATAYRMAMQWTLELLALPYADHPDYDQSWRP